MNERLVSLLSFLELNCDAKVEEVKGIKHTYNINDKKYMILTREEANITHEKYIQNVVNNYSNNRTLKLEVDYIIDSCIDSTYFDETMREHYEDYVDDIEYEEASNDSFKTRLEEEMAQENCKDKNSYINYLCSLHKSGVEWYRNSFGDIDFFETASEEDAINIKKVSEFYIEEYGRGYNLANYDGEELELANGYYAYRLY